MLSRRAVFGAPETAPLGASGRCGLRPASLALLLCLGGFSCLRIPPAEAPAAADQVEPDVHAPVVLSNGLGVGDVYRPLEVREFVIKQGGLPIGRSWGRYLGRDENDGFHTFETRVEITLPTQDALRSTGELVIDGHGFVVRGFERSVAAEVVFERRGEVLTFTDGQQEDEVSYAPDQTPTAVMAHSAILHEELMLAMTSLFEGEQSLRLISLSGGPPVDWTGTARRSGDQIVVETNLGERISLRAGRLVELSVTNSDLRIEPAADPHWPEWNIDTPQRPHYTVPADARFDVHPVELPGREGEPRLFGEVLQPRNATGPVPAILYISSSGREDRFGFAGPPPVDLGSHAITDALANAGFVVLRFDERGQGESEAGPNSFYGQVEDARRAFRTLLVQDAIATDRVFVVGHGEGGLRALHVIANQEVAGVALLATPGRRYREVLHQQAAAALANVPPEIRETAERQQKAMLEALESDGPPPLELEAQAQWIREMLGQDPARLLGQVRGALFLAQGGKDFEVDPRADLDALLSACKTHGLRPTVHRYPTLDHLFKLEPERSRPARYLEPGREVDPVFLADLVGWVRRVARIK